MAINNFIGEIAICETKEELNHVFFLPEHQKMLQPFKDGNFERNVLISELAEISNKFRGSTMDNILWLFQKMDLEKQLVQNLNNKKWNRKAKTIQQLASLQQESSIKDIFPLTNNKNDLLRMEAQIAIVKVTGFEGLAFLDEAIYPVSEWQQLRLIEELARHTAEVPGKISQWLRSENLTVVNFALRLIEIYRQYKYYDEVTHCLSHSSMSICNTAVVTLSQISNETTTDLLVTHYPDYDEVLQIQILKILQIDGTENQVPFLLSLLNHPDDSYKLEAAKAIMNIMESGIEKIEKIIDKSLFPWNIILSQIQMQEII